MVWDFQLDFFSIFLVNINGYLHLSHKNLEIMCSRLNLSSRITLLKNLRPSIVPFTHSTLKPSIQRSKLIASSTFNLNHARSFSSVNISSKVDQLTTQINETKVLLEKLSQERATLIDSSKINSTTIPVTNSPNQPYDTNSKLTNGQLAFIVVMGLVMMSDAIIR